MIADGVEAIAAGRPGHAAKGEKQRHRAHRRHDEVDIRGFAAVLVLVARNDQRPGTQGHEFPEEEEAECVVRHEDEVHGGAKGGIEGLDPFR